MSDQAPIDLSTDQIESATAILVEFSVALDDQPLILSQDGRVIASSGLRAEAVAERIARAADRLWNRDTGMNTPEVISFAEITIEEADRANFMLYSRHITGPVILSVGWDGTPPLAELRAGIRHAVTQLLGIVNNR